MNQSATIKLFLPSGDPTRLRVAEISNWSGKAVAAPRTEFHQLLLREEAGASGVYILTGFDPTTNESMAYVGEAEILKDRLPAHNRLEFWIQIIIFVSKDDNLTKAHIRYLEGRLIGIAKNVGRVKLHNGQASGSRLPESEKADAEVFLDKLQQLLPVLGTDIVTPVTSLMLPQNDSLVQVGNSGAIKTGLTFRVKNVEATGQRTSTGFVVFKGSQAVIDNRPSLEKQNPAYLALRKRLREKGDLVEEDTYLRFARDVEFKSPSAAAVAVCGGSANGLTSWKDSRGRMLKDLEKDSIDDFKSLKS